MHVIGLIVSNSYMHVSFFFFYLTIFNKNIIICSAGETSDFFLVTSARLLQSFCPLKPTPASLHSFASIQHIQSSTDNQEPLFPIIRYTPMHATIRKKLVNTILQFHCDIKVTTHFVMFSHACVLFVGWSSSCTGRSPLSLNS